MERSNGGIGFTSALTIVFIALKLVGIINWSWVWVLAPLWISFALCIVLYLIAVIVIKIINK